MAANAMRVGYRLVRNATSTADRAPYLGVAVPVGSLAYDNILMRMLERGTYMTRATAQYFLNAFYEYAAEAIADDVVRINMGAVSIFPMIGGPFYSEDDTYREPRNTLYVGATLSQEIRDAVSGIVPASLGEGAANGTVRISSVMDLASETYRLIDGLNEFRIVGIDLTVPDGEDESLALVAADGTTKVADITVVSTDDGQRIVCTLASAVPAGTYYVRLVSHGLDPTAPLSTVLHKVTVKAAETPPEPEPVPIAQSSDGKVKVMSATGGGEGGAFTPDDDWTLGGEGLWGEFAEGRTWILSGPEVSAGGASYPATFGAMTGGTAVVTAEAGPEEAGTYDAELRINLSNVDPEAASETLVVPFRLVVE